MAARSKQAALLLQGLMFLLTVHGAALWAQDATNSKGQKGTKQKGTCTL